MRSLRINAVELLRQPGAVRTVEAGIDGELLGVDHERLAGAIGVALRLEAVHDGDAGNSIMVTGHVEVPWATECRRCLEPLTGTSTAAVDELYQRELVDDAAFPIENGQLDLVPLVREAALLDLDEERLCRAECAGLCPICGTDRNDVECDCDTTVRDERWAALDDLVLPADD